MQRIYRGVFFGTFLRESWGGGSRNQGGMELSFKKRSGKKICFGGNFIVGESLCAK